VSGGRPSKLSPQQQAEIRVLVANGSKRWRVAAEYKVSETTISRIIGSTGRMGAPLRPRGRCVVCKGTKDVTRFGLMYRPSFRASVQGAGSLDLCLECWTRHASGRRRKARLRVPKPESPGE
jgi:hypothetical protein